MSSSSRSARRERTTSVTTGGVRPSFSGAEQPIEVERAGDAARAALVDAVAKLFARACARFAAVFPEAKRVLNEVARRSVVAGLDRGSDALGHRARQGHRHVFEIVHGILCLVPANACPACALHFTS